jgi:threonine/homoserine/homoserine lactone efflux protein
VIKLLIQFFIGVIVGIYGYLTPSYMNLAILQLSSQNRTKELWKCLIVISLVELPYCYFCMNGMQWIMQQKILLLIIKWLIVIVLFVFAFLSYREAKREKPVEENTIEANLSVRSLLTIAIFNPFQLSAWAIWGSYFVEKTWFVWTPLSILIFSVGAAVGVFIILRTYAFAGKKLVNYFNVNKSKMDYVICGILLLLAIIQLVRNVLY